MCGILGTTKKVKDKDFNQALDLISHRGPDSTGSLLVDNTFLGHKRLSIIDLSVLGNQPMSDGENEVYIIFNGEIYNFLELKKDLINEGCIFDSNTDTEVIIKGYKKRGVSFFNRMRGMWAFSILDRRNNKIILSRDLFGIKPLYYSLVGGDLSFCSELKPLSRIIGFIPDKFAYETFFSFGSMVFNKTGVDLVEQVLPGEIVEFNLDSKEILKTQMVLSDDSIKKYKNLEEALSDSIKFHYVSDVPVSILFSGGIDSSILALLSKKQGFNPTCFCVEMKDSEDSKYSEIIAKKLNLKLEKLYFDEKYFEKSYEEILNKLDIPISDISILPTYAIFNIVKNKTKVALSGEGGDELFGGYLRHKFLYRTKIKDRSFIIPKLYKNNFFGLKFVAPIQYRVQKMISNLIRDTSIVYAMNSMTFYDPDLLKQSVCFLRGIENTYKDFFPDSLVYDMSIYLPYMLMLKGDRASMFNSVEGRVPFLDRNLFSYVSGLYKKGEKLFFKEELKKILLGSLPEELVYRKKQGFGVSKKIFGKKFKVDFIEAFKFHKEKEGLFGPLPFDLSEDENFYDLIIEKYPRFAFGLITSFYVWKSYGL